MSGKSQNLSGAAVVLVLDVNTAVDLVNCLNDEVVGTFAQSDVIFLACGALECSSNVQRFPYVGSGVANVVQR